MLSRPIHSCHTLELPDTADPQTLAPLRATLPATVRRVTIMGLMVAWLTRQLSLSPDVAVIYATQYSEAHALERYLESFPLFSPLLFQTSIHPGAIQQVWIARKTPLQRLHPISGGTHIVASALQNALLCDAKQVLIIGGEEQSSWLHQHHIGSPNAFGFCLELGPQHTTGGIGTLSLKEESTGTSPPLLNFTKHLAAKEDIPIADPNGGHYHLHWATPQANNSSPL